MLKCNCCNKEASKFYGNDEGVILCSWYCIVEYYKLKPFEYSTIGGERFGKN